MRNKTYIYRGQHRIELEKEAEFFTAILPHRQMIQDLREKDEVQQVKRVFDNVYKIKTADIARDDTMISLRSNESLGCVCHHAYRPVGDPGTRYYLTEKVIVGFETGTSIPEKEAVLEEHGLKYVKAYAGLQDVYLLEVTGTAGKNPVKVCMDLVARKEIRFAEPNLINRYQSYHRPTDDLFGLQWHLQSSDDIELVAGADVGATKAWDLEKGKRDIIIAVLDDGFDLSHPDFQGAGKVVGARDFIDNDLLPDPSAQTGDFHGTPVAGVAIGEENGMGIVGSAPGCAFMPIRFDLRADDNLMFEIFEYAGRRAHVMSNSWGPVPVFAPLSSLQHEQIIDLVEKGGPDGKGCSILFAAGNYNAPLFNMSNTNFEWRHPSQGLRVTRGAILNGYAAHSHVIAVSASTSLNRKAAYSNWGKEINFCAPSNNFHPIDPQARLAGRGIWTADNEENGLGFTIDSRYTGRFGGTSSATPLAAGVLGLVKSANPDLTATEIQSILEITADKIEDTTPDPVLGRIKGTYDDNGHSEWFGFGKINAEKAVLAARAKLPQPENEEERPAPPPLVVNNGAIRVVAALVNPSGREAGSETISLLNISNDELNLGGWQIQDSRGRTDTIGDVSIAAGVMQTFVLRSAKLTNSGGSISLLTPEGELMEQVNYSASDARREGWLVKF